MRTQHIENLRSLSRSLTPNSVSRDRSSRLSVPGILLGALVCILDSSSTGLLVFPTNGEIFGGLQAQSIAMFTWSTIICQLVFVLGGSNFSQSQGLMLIEVIPFLQHIANKLATIITEDRDTLLATVCTAYALSSLVLGGFFLVLGFFEMDRWIAYFPETVLVGALGAIGLSLFLSGFEVTQRSTFSWDLNYIRGLFTNLAMPVTVVALVLTVVLCICVRIKKQSGTRPNWQNSLRKRIVWDVCALFSNPFFTPTFFLLTGIVFWIAAIGRGVSTESLKNHHWVFVHVPPEEPLLDRMRFYEFWQLFNFRLVRWDAIRQCIVEIVVLVIIGAINLPIYYPALRDQLPNVPRNTTIQRELIGHGVTNLLSGLTGSLPNMIVMSNTLFFARAGGDRSESIVVLAVIVLFFVLSKLILPYIPVLCAAIMVFFIGIELMAEALVPTWATKSALEYLVIAGTIAACTALGFAQGVGVGIAATLAAHGFEQLADYEIRTCFVPLREFVQAQVLSARVYDRLKDDVRQRTLQIGVISLNGTAGYTTASKLKQAVYRVQFEKCSALVIDLTYAVRIDFAAAAAIAAERANAAEGVHHPPAFLLGVPRGSNRYGVLVRAGALPRDPNALDPLEAHAMLHHGLWPINEFSEVIGWISGQASVSHARLPRWARVNTGLRPASSSRRPSVDIPMECFGTNTPGTAAIDPTLPTVVKWRACMDQLCCAPMVSTQDDQSFVSSEKTLLSEDDLGNSSASLLGEKTLHPVWRDSFAPVLEEYGKISFHAPNTLLSSVSDPHPDIRIVVTGSLELRFVSIMEPATSSLNVSNPSGIVDRTPSDWLHSAYERSKKPRMRRRGLRTASPIATPSQPSVTISEQFSQGDVVGLSELNFAESPHGELVSAGQLDATTITIDFSAQDVRTVSSLALALNAYHSHNQFRNVRIQDLYRRALNQGEQHVW
ncbi:hypothetical protein MVES_001756 [Malassezia vespertilionis]|uniref:SLC26A/SulP transporter domain-containing protein n=2 Tax=Malassezia vespertilionis TaxID=2020962 RepID=A0A2N1JDE4_9BASI|nr:hypothetical protein MVES_001756 [Malassezia vespertilionis]